MLFHCIYCTQASMHAYLARVKIYDNSSAYLLLRNARVINESETCVRKQFTFCCGVFAAQALHFTSVQCPKPAACFRRAATPHAQGGNSGGETNEWNN